MTIQPLGTAFELEDCARALAARHNLIDQDGNLTCWNCYQPCPWHVSLHCTPCRVSSIAGAPERRRLEYEARKSQEQREQEQSRPQQKVGGRSFRDDY